MAPVPSVEDTRKALIVAVANGLRIVPDCPYTRIERCDGFEQEAFKKETNSAATKIADAALLAFHQGNEPTLLPADSLTISWNPLIHEYLYIVVLDRDLQAHMADKCSSSNQTLLPTQGCIQFWVHETGSPEKLAYRGGLINIGLNDFKQNPPVELVGYGPVRWVAHRMNPSQLFDAKALQARRALDALRKELGDEATEMKN